MMTCIERLRSFFDEYGVKYEVQEHRDVFTMQEVAAEVHEKGAHVAKVVIAWAEGKLIMLVLPAPAHADFDKIKDMLGVAQARPAREDEFKFLFPDCDIGAMPPFGNLYAIPVYVHRSLTEEPYLVFQAGSHRKTMKIAMKDYLRLASPTAGDFIVHAQPAGAAA
jgi:Ala-tRNA(Pro) deacylase